MDGICYIMCPGTAINHHETDPNTSMKKISDTEIHIYAIQGMKFATITILMVLHQNGWQIL